MSVFEILSHGLLASEQLIQYQSNDLVNLQTPGYRRSQISFATLLSNAPGSGYAAVTPDISAGALLQTGRPLDLYLQPDIYFAVSAPDGTAYSRLGHLSLNAAGALVDGQGNPVHLSGNSSALTQTYLSAVTINAEGELRSNEQKIGELRFVKINGPIIDSDGYVRHAADIAPVPAKASVLLAGGLDASNTSYVDAMLQIFTQTRYMAGLQSAYQRINNVYDQSITELTRF